MYAQIARHTETCLYVPKNNESVFLTGIPKSGKFSEKHQIY